MPRKQPTADTEETVEEPEKPEPEKPRPVKVDPEPEEQLDEPPRGERDDSEPDVPTTGEPPRDRRTSRPARRRSKLIGPCNVYRHLHDPDREHETLKARTSSDRRYAEHPDWELVETIVRTPDDYRTPS